MRQTRSSELWLPHLHVHICTYTQSGIFQSVTSYWEGGPGRGSRNGKWTFSHMAQASRFSDVLPPTLVFILHILISLLERKDPSSFEGALFIMYFVFIWEPHYFLMFVICSGHTIHPADVVSHPPPYGRSFQLHPDGWCYLLGALQ